MYHLHRILKGCIRNLHPFRNMASAPENRALQFGVMSAGDNTSVVLTLPGPKLGDYTYHADAVAPWLITQYLESGQMLSFTQTTFPKFILGRLYREDIDHTIRPGCLVYNITESFHNNALGMNLLDIKTSVGRVGHNKIRLHQTVTDHVTSECYMSLNMYYSYLNLCDKPSYLPDWFVTECDANTSEVDQFSFNAVSRDLETLEVFQDSSACFKYRDKIKHHDLDNFSSARNSAYIRYCHNAKILAAKEKGLVDESDQLHKQTSLKSVKCLHSGDSCYGDDVEVRLWDMTSEPGDVQLFVIHNLTREKDVFCGVIDFYHDCKRFASKDHNDFFHNKKEIGLMKTKKSGYANRKMDILGCETSMSHLRDFNCRTGNIQPWRVADTLAFRRYMMMLDSCRYSELYDRSNCLIFILVYNLNLTRKFYECGRKGLFMNLFTESSILNVGRSSFDTSTVIKVDDQDIGMFVERIVLVDPVLRKPSNTIRDLLPQYFGEAKSCTPPVYQKPHKMPADHFASSFHVKPSDIDTNNHVNHTVYLIACMENAIMATNGRRFTNFTGDFEQYAVSNMSILFAGESEIGDTLDVYSWESSSRNDELCFIIRKGEQSLFYATFQFYMEIDDVSLPVAKL